VTEYDRTSIPASYDSGRDHGPAVLRLWMDAVAAHLDSVTPARILDLGCGTGRFSDALSVHFHAEVIGVDPSRKMLAQARQKRTEGVVHYEVGSAEAIPVKAQSVDLIFMSMSYHHFSDPLAAALECRRVLRNEGFVFVRTGSREQIESYPYYPFFPETHTILREVLPTSSEMRNVFEDAGFRFVAHDIITQTIAPSWQVYADKLATGADSVLARLSEQDFERGIAAVRRHNADDPDHPITEPIDLLVFRSSL
jgi:ubiquinone/menaquinone biosynthesis C-methylase UbiE